MPVVDSMVIRVLRLLRTFRLNRRRGWLKNGSMSLPRREIKFGYPGHDEVFFRHDFMYD